MKLVNIISKTLLLCCCLLLFLGGLGYYHFAWKGDIQDVVFTNESGLKLAGLFLKPPQPGRHPAIVIVHGSGPETRGKYRVPANQLVRNGFAVLVYDKHGTGNSEGDFAAATYGAFVEDAVAAVRYLRARSDVDSRRIGLFGVSEGGWLTPEIAERAEQIAFIVNQAGPPISWMETVRWEFENDLRADGFDERHLDETVDLVHSIWQYYVDTDRDGPAVAAQTRASLTRRIAALQGVPGFTDLGVRVLEHDPVKYALRAERYSYDPRPFLERARTPIFYVFGGRDVNIPTERSVAYLENLVARGYENISFRVYDDLGHSLAKWNRILTAGYPRGHFSRLAEWAKEQPRAGEGRR